MAEGSTFILPHLADYTIHVSLFKDVANADFLRQQLIEGNAEFEYAFIDATAILSVKHLLAAIFRATNDAIHNRLRSKNVHSEIVFSLSPNNNIAESFRRFGIQPTTTALLAVKVLPTIPPPEPSLNPSAHLASVVQGTRIPFDDENVAFFADEGRIAKIYRVTDLGKGEKGKGANGVNGVSANGVKTDSRGQMEGVILGIMALKGS